MSLWMHLGADHCVVDPFGVIHAATFESFEKTRKRKRRTVDAVCGAGGKVYTAEASDRDGNTIGHVALAWPPRVASLGVDQSRCGDCYRLTGHPRLDPLHWPKGTVR